MQPNTQQKSMLLPVIILVVVLGTIIYFYISSQGNDAALVKATASANEEVVGKDLLIALNRLNAIKLDDSLLKDKVFVSLQDFTVAILPQPVGRDNPFLPLKAVAPVPAPKKVK
ncbi:MAG: hypothetical protein EXS50_01730 [Candidatus Taylorbacteria bacterium]|nr:hypothetical protein [Candidatus Taylorbacteria bacterium]